MSLGLRNDRRRRRRQFRQRMLRWVLALAVIAGAGVYAYQTGGRLAEKDVASRDEQIRTLTDRLDGLQEQAQMAAAERDAARTQAEEWQQRYQRDVATGETRELIALVQAKLAEGVSAERLRKAVEHVDVRLECDPHPQVRRLLVRTPLAKGADSPVTFGGGAVAIAVSGASVRNAAGAPESWFDPKQPVTIRITAAGGKTSEIAGVLPQQQVLSAGDREYRLSIAAASRGFAQATVEQCRMP